MRVTRYVAFALLAVAAFDWPLPWLDRAGSALVAGALLALSVGAASGARRARSIPVPPKRVTLDGVVEDTLSDPALSRLLASVEDERE